MNADFEARVRAAQVAQESPSPEELFRQEQFLRKEQEQTDWQALHQELQEVAAGVAARLEGKRPPVRVEQRREGLFRTKKKIVEVQPEGFSFEVPIESGWGIESPIIGEYREGRLGFHFYETDEKNYKHRRLVTIDRLVPAGQTHYDMRDELGNYPFERFSHQSRLSTTRNTVLNALAHVVAKHS